jgi:hypothetical protein
MNLLIGFYIIKHGIVQMEYIFNGLDKGYCVSSLNCFLVALKHYGFGLESTLLNLYVVFCVCGNLRSNYWFGGIEVCHWHLVGPLVWLSKLISLAICFLFIHL